MGLPRHRSHHCCLHLCASLRLRLHPGLHHRGGSLLARLSARGLFRGESRRSSCRISCRHCCARCLGKRPDNAEAPRSPQAMTPEIATSVAVQKRTPRRYFDATCESMLKHADALPPFCHVPSRSQRSALGFCSTVKEATSLMQRPSSVVAWPPGRVSASKRVAPATLHSAEASFEALGIRHDMLAFTPADGGGSAPHLHGEAVLHAWPHLLRWSRGLLVRTHRARVQQVAS